ncbi:unnamed protein product [Prorocentrum cordatum]|uniref:Chlorophyll a-b binding protein, chloroplastic n=1 Tax=Prorocentrum cordatum TaxID=2364126 RepID=A0ABN9WD95_9DINO|nr:unnamed protein product [Polarella glacialis]
MELAAPAFVTPAAAGPAPPATAALRGAPAAGAPPAAGGSFGLLAPLGLGAACATLGAQRRRQRGAGAARRAAQSYKAYSDSWLANADLGVDPLNLAVGTGVFDKAPTAVPETTYYNYRESEVKHGRFAMVVFLASFFEEADRGAVLKQLGVSGAVDNLDATLGLDEVQAPVLLVGIGIQALAEYNLQKSEDDGNILSLEYKKDRCPGDLGFDPVGVLAGKGTENMVYLHNVVVNTGKLAMIGVTAFLAQEFLLKR